MNATTLDLPQYAAQAGRLQLTRTDGTDAAMPASGPTSWWADGTTSYVLHFRSGHVHGWTIADETDTVIQAVDSLRAGEEISGDRLRHALRDVRRLRTRLAALESELILYAREDGSTSYPRLSLRDVAEEVGVHHTTVAERHTRMVTGEHAAWRPWLVQDTPRADMYQAPGYARRVDVTAWDRGQDPAARLCSEAHADGVTGCGRPHGHHAVPDDIGHQDHDGRRWAITR
ncbi:hypothetical protein JHN49_04535 [Streptomyces sp. MBT57]|nr:hypothetical protein [Streptomyces sp. MBT57]